jgi:hypothetical protein
MPSGAQVVYDRSLKRRLLRQAGERSWPWSAEDKLGDLVVRWLAGGLKSYEPRKDFLPEAEPFRHRSCIDHGLPLLCQFRSGR